MDPIVIVGNGVAAVSAVETFRAHDKNTRIIIVSAEPYHAYYRMRLSHLLGKNPEVEKPGDLCKEESAHAAITDIQPENNIYRKVFFKNNVPVGVILLGDTKPAMKILRAIKIGRDIPEDIIKANNFERFSATGRELTFCLFRQVKPESDLDRVKYF